MCNKHCRDTLSDLLAMTFVDFFELEVYLHVKSLYEEEIENNKAQLQERK